MMNKLVILYGINDGWKYILVVVEYGGGFVVSWWCLSIVVSVHKFLLWSFGFYDSQNRTIKVCVCYERIRVQDKENK